MADRDIDSVNSHDEYWIDEFQSVLDNTSGINYDSLANELKTDVSTLSNEFSSIREQMEVWRGKAQKTALETIERIMDRYDCSMENINESLGPACEKIEEYKELLIKLKEGKEELTGADGNGGLDKELEILTQEYETKEEEYNNIKNSEPQYSGGGADEAEKQKLYNAYKAKHASWEASLSSAETAMNDAKTKMEDKEEEIKAKELELNNLLEEVYDTSNVIKQFVNSVKSFKTYLGNTIKEYKIKTSEEFDTSVNRILDILDIITLKSAAETSTPVLLDYDFFEKACKEHSKEGWKIEDDVVTMIVDGKECTYDLKQHMFSCGDVDTNKNDKKIEIETYFYLPEHIVESNDFSQLENLDTYTFFSSNQENYKSTLSNREINSLTMMVIKQDPFNGKYETVRTLTKTANTIANTDLTKCQNAIAGDSVYGAHSLKIAASSGDLYNTVYCVDNAAIVTGQNGKTGTKEQFDSIEDLKGLDNKNIYFINTSGDDNYSFGAKIKKDDDGNPIKDENGNNIILNAYQSVETYKNISTEQVKDSFTYTGIELVAENCPNSKIHIVYQDEDTAKTYQRTNFPIALDELADKYDNVWNDSVEWDFYAKQKYKTHSEGNYIPHDLAETIAKISPVYTNYYKSS